MDLKQIISFPLLQKWLNHNNLKIKNVEKLRKTYQGNSPFHNICIKDLLQEKMLTLLISAVQELEYEEIESDLFKFLQSNGLENSEHPTIKNFYQFLQSNEFKAYLGYISGLSFSKNVDLFASVYENTHFLLPHDDQLKGRKLAFVYYLSSLEETNGGKIILYSTKNKKPIDAQTAYIPTQNSFLCFTVSQKSFHEVEEVVGNNQRVALGGWFHG